MAKLTSVQDLSLGANIEVVSNEYKKIAQLAQDVAMSMQGALSSATEARATAIYKKIEGMAEQMDDASMSVAKFDKKLTQARENLEDIGDELDDIVKKEEELVKAQQELLNLSEDEKKAREEQLEAEKEILAKKKATILTQKQQLENEIEVSKQSLQQLDLETKKHNKKMKYYAEELEFQKDSMEELSRDIKNAGGKTAMVLKGAGSLFSSASGGGLQSMMSGAGDMITNVGKMFSGIGGKMGSGLLSGLGSVLGKAGPIVAGFMAVGQAAMDADKKIKDANKGILETTNIADITGPSLEGLNDKIGGMRKAFLDLNAEVGLDDSKELFSSLSGAGYDLRLMGRDTGKMKGAMKGLAQTSSALGISFSEGAEFMAMFRKELGVNDMQKIADVFTDIRDSALKAGMNTKELADSVKRLYSGLGKFNVGIHQVTNTFLKLRKVIGKEAAEEMLESLKGGYSESGVKERIEAGLKMGEGRMKKIVGRTATRSTATLMKDISGNENYKKMIRTAGFKATSGAGLQKELAGLSQEEAARRLASMRQAGEEQGVPIEDVESLQQKMRSAMNVSKGAKGTIRGGGLLKGMGEIDVAGMLSSKILQAAALGGEFEGGRLHRIESPEQLAALENVTGMSAKQIQIMKSVTQDLEGEMLLLQERAAKGKLTAEEQEKYGVSAQGKLIDKTTGEEMTFEKYLEINEKRLNEEAEKKGAVEKSNQELLQEQILATRSVADQINAKLAPYLDSLNSTVSAWFDSTRKDTDSKAKKEALADIDKEIGKQQGILATATDEGTKAKAKKAIEIAQSQKRYIKTKNFEAKTSKEIMKAEAGAEVASTLNPEDKAAFAKKRLLELATKAGVSTKEGMTTTKLAEGVAHASDKTISSEEKKELFNLMDTLGYQGGKKAVGRRGSFGAPEYEFKEKTAGSGEDVYTPLTPEEQRKEDIKTSLEAKKAAKTITAAEQAQLAKQIADENAKRYDVKEVLAEVEALAKDKGKLADFSKEQGNLEKALKAKSSQDFFQILNQLGVDPDSYAYKKGEAFFSTETGEAGDWVKVGNKVHRFSNSDIAFGVDPAGMKGPLKDILGGGGGMSKGMVNITINGGDEQRVYAAVKRALLDAGYGSV